MIAINRQADLWGAGGVWRYSGDWIHYFKANDTMLMEIPWHLKEALSPRERRAIAHSIAIFQLGESSDGRHFMAAGKAYVEASGDTHYQDALGRFIAEEHRHARDLGRFMRAHDIPLQQHRWTDNIFRCIRNVAGLEVCISVLVTAELIAKTYYLQARSGELVGGPVQVDLRATTDPIVRYNKASAAYLKAHKIAKFSTDPTIRAAVEVAYDAMVTAEALAYPA